MTSRSVPLASFLVLAACSTDPSFETGATSGEPTGEATVTSATGSGAASGTGGQDASSPSSSGPGGGGDGGASTTTGASASTVATSSVVAVSAVSTGTGAECIEADDCRDANPCTIDTCNSAGHCESVGVTPGEAGNPSEGSCPVGVCQANATCGLQVYSHAYSTAGPWQRATLSELWGLDDPDAPPFTGIREVVPLPSLGYFAVFTDEGGANILHVRAGDDWLAPQPAASYLPGLPTDIRCAYAYQPSASDPSMVLLLSGPGPSPDLQQAFGYTVNGAGMVMADAANPYAVDRTDEAGDPPPNTDLCRFSFAVQTGFLGDPSWVIAWDASGPNVYEFDGGSQFWTNHGADTGSPIWNVEGTGPASQSVVAAWFENDTVYFIAP